MLVQIYEAGNPREAAALAAAGVDQVGVLVGDGEFPRELRLEAAARIFAAIEGHATRVALSLSANPDRIRELVSGLPIDILHLGAAPDRLTPEDVAGIRRDHPRVKIMRSIPVVDDGSLEDARRYEEVADLLLLDSHREGDNQIGATGKTHDWGISRRIVKRVRIPCILAGGLHPGNVTEAIRSVRPAGVDSKTGTDRDGDTPARKDLERVRAFVRAAKTAAYPSR